MGTGKDLRDLQGFGRYLEERILPLAPVIEPVPFRGRRGEGEALPFFEDMDTHLRSRPGAVWSILGPPGTGKTYFARWAAARWAKLFLENPDGNPAPFWMDPKKLASLSAKSEAPPWQILLSAIAGELKEAPEDLSKVLAAHPVI